MSDNDILLEHMDNRFDAVIEAVGQMQDQLKVLPAMQADLEEVKSNVKTIKAVVTDQSSQLNDHETRISVLESA